MSGARIDGFSLVSDSAYVADNSARILRGMFEIVMAKEWSSTAKQVLNLSKALDQRCRPDTNPLRQVFDSFDLLLLLLLLLLNFLFFSLNSPFFPPFHTVQHPLLRNPQQNQTLGR